MIGPLPLLPPSSPAMCVLSFHESRLPLNRLGSVSAAERHRLRNWTVHTRGHCSSALRTTALTRNARAVSSRSPQHEAQRTMDDRNKAKSLELALAGIEKEFGKGAVMRLKDGELPHGEVISVPTGSLGLDVALGTG